MPGKYSPVFVIVCLGILVDIVLVNALVGQEKQKLDKRDRMAKDAAEEFIKAIWKQDLSATMKTVDVPFFWDGVENIKDRDALAARLKTMLRRDRSKIPFKTKAVFTFGKLPENSVSKRDLALLKAILDKSDRLVLIEFMPPGRDGIMIAVRFRGEKARVVGFRD
ncbi:MAG: hypothetical protein HYX68_02955 [Planctomycetes bacterium]|nr:hypothetical protein [Planctomycetota bacterium]